MNFTFPQGDLDGESVLSECAERSVLRSLVELSQLYLTVPFNSLGQIKRETLFLPIQLLPVGGSTYTRYHQYRPCEEQCVMGVDQAPWYPGWVSVEMASVPSFSLAYEPGCFVFQKAAIQAFIAHCLFIDLYVAGQ